MEKDGRVTYERFFEGGRVGMLIQMVNENGGITIVPETHRDLIISLLIRNDYIHVALLNAVVAAIKNCIPYTLWENVIRHQHLTL
jgi:hypothetical protein